jgi:putative endonuclease
VFSLLGQGPGVESGRPGYSPCLSLMCRLANRYGTIVRPMKGLVNDGRTELSGVAEQTNQLGRKGEKLARKFLRRQGYRIRAINYSCREGEIDIVAQDKKTIVFVEVRTLSSGRYGLPYETVTYKKRRHLTRTAHHYLHRYKLLDYDWRFDFVGIILSEDGPPEIELIKDAFAPVR